MCCRRGRPGPQESRQTLQFEPVPGRAAVPSLRNVWCPAQNLVYERAKRAAATFDERVVFEAFDTSDRATFLEWGIWDSLFIDGKEVRTGPPPSYEKLKGVIGNRLKKLWLSAEPLASQGCCIARPAPRP